MNTILNLNRCERAIDSPYHAATTSAALPALPVRDRPSSGSARCSQLSAAAPPSEGKDSSRSRATTDSVYRDLDMYHRQSGEEDGLDKDRSIVSRLVGWLVCLFNGFLPQYLNDRGVH